MIDNKELNKIFIQPNFQFYQSHEFQKLNQNLSSNRTFSIFHTNTCFKNENLDLLLNNLEHSFWDLDPQRVKSLMAYQKHHDTEEI